VHSPHFSRSGSSGVKSIGCPHEFHHIAEQSVIGSARTACLCLLRVKVLLPWFYINQHGLIDQALTTKSDLLR